jgi:hypothetical protein
LALPDGSLGIGAYQSPASTLTGPVILFHCFDCGTEDTTGNLHSCVVCGSQITHKCLDHVGVLRTEAELNRYVVTEAPERWIVVNGLVLGLLFTTDSRNIVLERSTGWWEQHFHNGCFVDAVKLADLCIKLSDGKSEYTLLRTKASVCLSLENASKALLAGQFETCIEILKPYDDSHEEVREYELESVTATLVIKKFGNKHSKVNYDWLVSISSDEISKKSKGSNKTVGKLQFLHHRWSYFVISYFVSMLLVITARFVWMRL